MSATEERHELLEMARALLVELRQTTVRVHHCIDKLFSEADLLMLAAAAEKEGEKADRKSVVYSKPVAVAAVVAAAAEGAPVELPPGKRGCSICRKPGHRAPNCPDAHKAREADMAAKAERDVKRKKRKK